MRKTIISSLFALIILFGAPLGAAEYRYFAGDLDALYAQLPPPPPDDSVAGQADLEALYQIQKDRTPEQVGRAKNVHALNLMEMGRHVFGPEFTADKLPRTAAFLKEVNMERHYIVHVAKKQWPRARPYDRGAGIKPCVRTYPSTNPEYPSYPSGHAAAGSLLAVFYSEAAPEYARLFDERARETAWARVLAGMHYPSDTLAGKQFGRLIAREMLKNPITREAVGKMRAEVQAFLKQNPEAGARAREQLQKLETEYPSEPAKNPF